MTRATEFTEGVSVAAVAFTITEMRDQVSGAAASAGVDVQILHNILCAIFTNS